MTRRKRNAAARTPLGDGYDQPHDVDDIVVAFPGNLRDLLPPWELIPENFRSHYGDAESQPWINFQSQWFYKGIKRSSLTARPDVDMGKALRHLGVIQGSFEPKHEHKVAAVAWLASRWLQAVAP